MPAKFFSARIYSNKLHVLGASAQSWWDPRRFNWWAEADVRAMLDPRAGDRFVTTHEENCERHFLSLWAVGDHGWCGSTKAWSTKSSVCRWTPSLNTC